MKTSKKTSENRGQEAHGGKVVGTTSLGVIWVSYGGEAEYQEMCRRFDATQK